MTTITASSTLGLDLNPAFYASPIVIVSGVTISNPSYPAVVYSHPGSSTFFTLENNGSIRSTSGIGVYLFPGASITNSASGYVRGSVGIQITGGAGTVVNAGGVGGTSGVGVSLASGGSVANTGTIDGVRVSGTTGTIINNGGVIGGISLEAGGTINNGGRLSGVGIDGGTVVMSNSGTIGLSGDAVVVAANAAVVLDNTGLIVGSYGIHGAGGGSISNEGTIKGTAGWGIKLDNGGTVVNSGLISGGFAIWISGQPGTLLNSGYIAPQVWLAEGGYVANSASGRVGLVEAFYGPATIKNYGYVGGIILKDGGRVTNFASARASIATLSGESLLTNFSSGTMGLGIMQGLTTLFNGGQLYAFLAGGSAQFDGGGVVTNAASGTIGGGIRFTGVSGTVINGGAIQGINFVPGTGVELGSGGTFINQAGALLTGNNGVTIGGGAASISNAGTISATHAAGISAATVVTITNASSAYVSGSADGIDFSAGGTLIDAGTIVGSSGTAVAFGGTGDSLLALEPGYAFSGLVSGGTNANATIELASAHTVGTVNGLGSQMLHFRTIAFDPGASWFVSGLPRGLSGPITGFAPGDTIEVTGVSATASSYVGGVLTLNEAVGYVTLDLAGPFSLANFRVTNVAAGADVSVACFRAGTRIRTPRGAVAIEELRAGDSVVSARGEVVPISWVGRQTCDCRDHPRPRDVYPVRIRRGAFSTGIPCRDLWLSPDHAIFIAGALIPVRYLINGISILQDAVDRVIYYHLELSMHDVVLAEELPAESYLDTGNRLGFLVSDDQTSARQPISRRQNPSGQLISSTAV
jgi:hypothetical protein